MKTLSLQSISKVRLSLSTAQTIIHLRRIAAVMLCLLTFGVGEMWGEPWVSRSTNGGKIATKTVGDKLNGGNEWNYTYITNGGWNNATDIQVLVGTSTSSYTSVNAVWKSDGDGSNKNVAADIGNVSFDKSGLWYAVGKYTLDSKTVYTTTNGTWTNNETLAFGTNSEPYWQVNPPAIKSNSISISATNTAAGSGSGLTSGSPIILVSGMASTLTITATQNVSDANSALYCKFASGSYSTTKTYNIAANTLTSNQTLALNVKYRNNSASLDGAETTATIYYKWAAPSPAVTLSAAKTTGINVGETVRLTATGSNASNITTYDFYEGETKKGTVTTTATTATYDYIPTTTGNKTVKVVMTYSNGSNTITSSNVSLTLNVPSVSLAVKAGSSSEIYLGETTTIMKATPANVGAGVTPSYVFTDQASPAVSSSSQTATEWTYMPSKTGTKTMKVTMSVGGSTYTATATVKVYEHWNIYVHDLQNWNSMYLYMFDATSNNAAWPGAECSNYNGSTSWYTVTLDSKYTGFNLASTGGTYQTKSYGSNLDVNMSTYAANTYWYIDAQTGGKLVKLTLSNPTVEAPTLVKACENQLTLRAQVTNCGGDGNTAADMKAVGFTINGNNYAADCTDGTYFYKTITGLTANTAYSVTAYATNIKGTGTSTAASHTTLAHTTHRIQVRSSQQPYLYAWTDNPACSTGKIENGTYGTVASAVTMTSYGITGTMGTWYYFDLAEQYDKFLITIGSGTSTWNTNKTADTDNPKEDKCYWYWNNSEKSSHGGQTFGTMSCPYLRPQLMIETTAGSGSYSYYEMTGSGTITYDVPLAADASYKFKIVYNTDYYTKSGTILTASSPASPALAVVDGSDNECQIKTTVAGSYTFSFNTSSKVVSVTYPSIPTMTGTLSLAATGAAGGNGTSGSPYLVFKDKTLTFTATHGSKPATATDHIWYQFTDNSAAQTAVQSPLTYSPSTSATGEMKALKVEAYYEYGPTGYKTQGAKLASSVVYYQVVPQPTLSITIPQEAKVSTDFNVSVSETTGTSLTGVSAPTYKWQYRLVGGSWAYYAKPSTSSTEQEMRFSTKGFYEIRAEMTYGNQTWYSAVSQMCLYDTWQVTVILNETTNGWFKGLYAYRDTNTDKVPASANADHWKGVDITDPASGVTEVEADTRWTYTFKTPVYTHVMLTDYSTNGANRTAEIEITSNTCITVTGSRGVANKNWAYSTEANCATSYCRIKSVVGDNVYYSNVIPANSAPGTKLSYYASTSGTLVMQTLTNGSWVDGSVITPAGTGVYVANYSGSGYIQSGSQTLYTGAYKLYSKAVEQGQNHNGENPEFTSFTPDAHTPYTHYWIDYMPVASVSDIRATVGNDINHNLAGEIVYDEAYTEGSDHTDEHTDEKSSVRYAYNPATNYFNRTILANTEQSKFLIFYGTDIQAQKDDGTWVNVNSYSDVDVSFQGQGRFADLSDWVYQIDVKATGSSKVTALAEYFSYKQYLFGGENAGEDGISLINDELTDTYTIRVMYDFKTNRITTAWLPDGTISKSIELNAAMMITREGNNDARQVTMSTDDVNVSKINQVFTVLEITQTNWSSLQTSCGGMFWISLPYDCYLKDIYGIPGYGTKWRIQRYRGDKRAEMGWFVETPTFWANMKQTETAKMEAGRGYVVDLSNLTAGDFKTGASSSVFLYFPSATGDYTMKNEAVTYHVPAHECTITSPEDRTKQDSHWNVVGVPTWHNATIATASDGTGGKMLGTYPNFYYSWSWNNSTKKGSYVANVVATGSTLFNATQAYMMQYAGDITWTKTTSTAALAPQRVQEPAVNRNICLSLSDTAELDRTFVQLIDGATDGYDLNHDLGKIITDGTTQLYTRQGNYLFAGDNRPVQNVNVPVDVRIASEGDYTFSVNTGLSGVRPVLYDRTEDRYTDLLFADYEVHLRAGEYAGRFELQLEVTSPSAPTGCIQTSSADIQVSVSGGNLLLSGVPDGADLCLYDALGRLLERRSSYREGDVLTAPLTGVYVLVVNGTAQRVLVP